MMGAIKEAMLMMEELGEYLGQGWEGKGHLFRRNTGIDYVATVSVEGVGYEQKYKLFVATQTAEYFLDFNEIEYHRDVEDFVYELYVRDFPVRVSVDLLHYWGR